MKDKGHFYTSLLKSLIRIVACALAITNHNIYILAIGLFIAEILGVAEEIFDKR